jgi:hypothetical protein
MIRLSATLGAVAAILWVSLVSFAAITLCVASQRMFVVVYFVMDSVWMLLSANRPTHLCPLRGVSGKELDPVSKKGGGEDCEEDTPFWGCSLSVVVIWGGISWNSAYKTAPHPTPRGLEHHEVRSLLVTSTVCLYVNHDIISDVKGFFDN